jgi:hypothetical protein
MFKKLKGETAAPPNHSVSANMIKLRKMLILCFLGIFAFCGGLGNQSLRRVRNDCINYKASARPL